MIRERVTAMRNYPVVFFLAAVVVTSAVGCQSMPSIAALTGSGAGSQKVQESKYPAPAKVAVIWSPAVMNQPGQPPTRGFGGRVYFYDASNSPVPVEGQLVVYGYNDSQAGAPGKAPERKYVYTPEQFTQHYSPTQLGASYSVWIPWDTVGQPQMEISLVPVFTAASGQLVVGQPSHNLLPGPTTAPPESKMASEFVPLQYGSLNQNGPPPLGNYDVQRVAYEQMAQQAAMQQSVPGQVTRTHPQGSLGVETMSITLPGTMADRLAQAPATASPLERLSQYRAAMANQAAAAPPMGTMSQATAMTPAASGGKPRTVGYQPPLPPAPTAPAPPPAPGRPPSQPFPGAPLSVPPATPR
jgi:hypothetical protein